MEESKVNRLIFWARMIQIALCVVALGFTITISTGLYYDEYGSSVSDISSCFLLGGVALFGCFALFAPPRRPDDIRDVRLYALILLIDCCAVASAFAAGVCQAVNLNYEGSSPELQIAPTVLSFLCVPVITPLIYRTLSLWWQRMLNTTPPPPSPSIFDKTLEPASYTLESISPSQYYQPSQYPPSHAPPRSTTGTCPSCHGDEVTSNPASRPLSLAETTAQWSAFSGAATLNYPNIMSAASQAAPSVTSGAEEPAKRETSQE